MTKKYKNKYNITSSRLQNWDYGSNAAYFITINTKYKQCFFGAILNQKMTLNAIGQIVEYIWSLIPNQFPYAKVDSFVVMPDHVHGILIIDKPTDYDLNRARSLSPIPIEKPKKGGITSDKNPMLQENVSRIIRWFKGRCSFEIRKINQEFEWQPKFYDIIIRNPIQYKYISRYIYFKIYCGQSEKMGGAMM